MQHNNIIASMHIISVSIINYCKVYIQGDQKFIAK